MNKFKIWCWITSPACGEHIQSHTIGSGSLAVFLPLEMKISSLSFLVSDADAVCDG